LRRANSPDGLPPRAGVTPLNALRKTSGFTSSAAAISTTGLRRSFGSVSCPPENVTVRFDSSARTSAQEELTRPKARMQLPERIDNGTPNVVFQIFMVRQLLE